MKKCVVVDLDNTLVAVNSLKEMTVMLLWKLIKTGKTGDLYRVLTQILKRRFHLIPHSDMKHTLVTAALKNFTDSDIDSLAEKLNCKINSRVKDIIIQNFEKGNFVLLATAAPDFYLGKFIEKSGFKNIDYIGTPFQTTLPDYKENKGEEKLGKVLKYLKDNDLECVSVISDHEDDLPLFKYFQHCENYLVKPDTNTIESIKQNLNSDSDFPTII